mgnify:FL=1
MKYIKNQLFPKNDENTFLEKIITYLIVFSIIIAVIETEKSFSDNYINTFFYLEIFFVVIFTIEYIFRFAVCGEIKKYRGVKGKIRFFFHPMTLIDLISILPSYILFFNSDFILLRALRLLRLLRVLKLIKHNKAINLFIKALISSRIQLLGSLAVTLFVLFISAILLYLVEGNIQPEQFGSIPKSMWWAMATLTTVGYGDVYPITAFGKLLSSMVAIIGIGIVALPAGIIAANYNNLLDKK